ncbi:hypothetical protein N9L47_00775 [Rhodobacteraceae bacterium]|nr:hypothetical protein [Paracoccaceae bacterium]
MPTFKFWAVVGLLALPGCTESFNPTRAVSTQIELPDGMIIAGANGWCVDPSVSRAGGDTAVIVLGSCAAIGQDALGPRPSVPGVVTVSVEREQLDAPTPLELESFFVSDTGRAALARDGQAGSVDILETRAGEDRFIMQTEDRSALPGASPMTWRGLFDLDGRFVSVSLYGLSDQLIEPEDGLATVEAQVDQLIAINTP